jgi:hypothetical protein
MSVERKRSLIIHESNDGDRTMLERLAETNGTILRGGPGQLAEVAGNLAAAAALSSDNDFSGDSFRESDALRDAQVSQGAVRPIQERWRS